MGMQAAKSIDILGNNSLLVGVRGILALFYGSDATLSDVLSNCFFALICSVSSSIF